MKVSIPSMAKSRVGPIYFDDREPCVAEIASVIHDVLECSVSVGCLRKERKRRMAIGYSSTSWIAAIVSAMPGWRSLEDNGPTRDCDIDGIGTLIACVPLQVGAEASKNRDDEHPVIRAESRSEPPETSRIPG